MYLGLIIITHYRTCSIDSSFLGQLKCVRRKTNLIKNKAVLYQYTDWL